MVAFACPSVDQWNSIDNIIMFTDIIISVRYFPAVLRIRRTKRLFDICMRCRAFITDMILYSETPKCAETYEFKT